MKEKGDERRVGEGPAVNVFSAWASTGDADKEKILFKEGLQALKVINASQYFNTNAKTNSNDFLFVVAERQRLQGQVYRLHDRTGANNNSPSCISHHISLVLSNPRDGDRLSSSPPSSSRCLASPPPPPSRGPSSSPWWGRGTGSTEGRTTPSRSGGTLTSLYYSNGDSFFSMI